MKRVFTMLSYFRHLFLPHHTNNFRAKILHHDAIVVLVAILMGLGLALRVGHRVEPEILGYATDIHVQELLRLTNEKRAQEGLPPLKLDSQLSAAAAGKAADMFSKSYWAHSAPDGTTPWDFINKSGYVYTVAGENLAKNFSDSTGVVAAWMNSVTHRENIMRSQYEDIGFAVVNGVLNSEETTLVVQMFGKRLSQPIAQKTVETPLPVIISQVAATETQMPLTQAVSVTEPSPALVISPQPQPSKQVLVAPASVVKKPLLDINWFSRNLALTVALGFTLVLAVDGLYVWRRNVVRAGGRHWAHLMFLAVVTTLIWSMSFGSIL